MNLKEVSEGRNNNFDFLRFFAAFIVIYYHCFPLYYGANGTQDFYQRFTQDIGIGIIGVSIFFIISGYLITASWFNCPVVIDFCKKRILRIYPALIVVIILTTFFLAPMVTTLPLAEYFAKYKALLHYLFNSTLIFFYDSLPGVFESNPYPVAVNGSMWTLPIELCCYIFVLLIGFSGKINKITNIVLISLFSVLFYISNKIDYQYFLLFFIGQAFYLYREKIVLNKFILIGCLTGIILSAKTPMTRGALIMLLPYIVFYFAYKFPIFNNFSKYGDFSYGLYIYAFPVQQTLMNYFKLSFYELFFYSSIITMFFAVLSWHLIEKNALKLKKLPVNLEDVWLKMKQIS